MIDDKLCSESLSINFVELKPGKWMVVVVVKLHGNCGQKNWEYLAKTTVQNIENPTKVSNSEEFLSEIIFSK